MFEDLESLTACVGYIRKDREVRIVRAKNRLDHRYDAKQSAGYRDVNLNVKITTEETSRVGLDMHVCEVLLLLRPFAERKHDEGHQRYIQFRNARGE